MLLVVMRNEVSVMPSNMILIYLQLACCRSGPPHSQDSVNRLPLIGHAGHCRRWPCFFVSVMNKCSVMMSTILIISGTLVWALYMQAHLLFVLRSLVFELL